MTPMMKQPPDHWVDLRTMPHRAALRMELTAAIDTALAIDPDQTFLRGYWTGVTTGYLTGFGLLTRGALDRAKATPWVRADADVTNWTRTGRYDEDTAWACGVLYGYTQAVSEADDLLICAHCSCALVVDIDPIEACECGWFCDSGCIAEYHTNLYGLPCEYMDGMKWPA